MHSIKRRRRQIIGNARRLHNIHQRIHVEPRQQKTIYILRHDTSTIFYAQISFLKHAMDAKFRQVKIKKWRKIDKYDPSRLQDGDQNEGGL